MICKAEELEMDGVRWYFQRFLKKDRTLDVVQLFTETGDFVEEFTSMEDLISYIAEHSRTIR